MFNIEFLSLGFSGILMRYYFLMAIVLVAGFSGYWLMGLFALPVFISAILGIKITLKPQSESTTAKAVILQQRKKAA